MVAAEAVATRTGIDVASLQTSATDLAALEIVAQWRVMDQVRVGACSASSEIRR